MMGASSNSAVATRWRMLLFESRRYPSGSPMSPDRSVAADILMILDELLSKSTGGEAASGETGGESVSPSDQLDVVEKIGGCG